MLKLILESGKSLELRSSSSFVIGRDALVCDFPIEDNSLSRRHAEIKAVEGNKLCICDLGSTNGTFLNGAALKLQTLYELRHGDQVDFGHVSASIVDSESSTVVVSKPPEELVQSKEELPVSKVSKKQKPQEQENNLKEVLEYVSFGRRLATALIDGVLLSLVGLIIALPFSSNQVLSAGINLFYVIFGYWFYYALMESSHYQATVGKIILKCKVTDLNGDRINFWQASGRYWAKIVSTIPLLLGYLLPFFDEKKQTLHDKISKCVIVKN